MTTHFTRTTSLSPRTVSNVAQLLAPAVFALGILAIFVWFGLASAMKSDRERTIEAARSDSLMSGCRTADSDDICYALGMKQKAWFYAYDKEQQFLHAPTAESAAAIKKAKQVEESWELEVDRLRDEHAATVARLLK